MAMRTSGYNLDACKHKVAEETPICPPDLGKTMTSEGAMARAYQVGDFVSVNKRSVHVRGYVDFYGGYANHCREAIIRLQGTGKYAVKLTPIATPTDIHPAMFSKMNWFINNPGFTMKNSTFLVIAGPGHLQKQFLPKESRRVIGWTMVETMDIQPEIAEWCNNADLILAPTSVDFQRFKRAGVKNLATVPVGYDPEYFNPTVKPMDISNVRDRYVFGVVGSWNYRKGVEEIIHAYCMAFNATDPVSLLLVCKYGNRPHGPDAENAEKWGIRAELRRCLDQLHMDEDMIPHICVLDVPLHPPVIPHVYSRIDCLVGFSAGESTWLPGLELAAIGRPIIQLSNQCCGYMDYMTGARYLCNGVEYVECDERMWGGTSEYYKGQKMGMGNAMELADMMEKVYTERGSIVQQGEILQRMLAVQPWQWGKCIEKLCAVLD